MLKRTPPALRALGVLIVLAWAVGCGREEPDVVWDGQIVQESGNTLPIEYGVFADWDSARYYIRQAGTVGTPISLYDFEVTPGTSGRPEVVSFKLVNPAGEEEVCALPRQPDASFRGPCVGGPVFGVSEFTLWPPEWEPPTDRTAAE